MRAPAVIWEVAYQADRRGHHHRCRCCNRVLKDGESALMVRVDAARRASGTVGALEPHGSGWRYRG